MDTYIRDFKVKQMETYTLQNSQELDEVLKVNSSKNKTFSILHNNICSINKNLDEFKVFFSEISSDINVVVLSETWHIPDVNSINLEGYNTVYNQGTFNQNDGVVAFVKSNLSFTYSIYKLGYISMLEIRIKFTGNNIIISGMYRSPSLDPSEFPNLLQEYLDDNESNRDDIHIFIGDINIDLLKDNEYTLEYRSTLEEHGFISTVNGCTRLSACLDHIFLKTKANLYDQSMSFIINTCITDHSSTALQIITDESKIEKNTDKNYVHHVEYKKLAEFLQKTSWNSVYQAQDVESATKKFISIMTNSINECTKKRLSTRKNTKKTPWITPALIKSINTKQKLFNNLQKNQNNELLKKQFKNYRNKLTALIDVTKYNYYKSLIEQNPNDSKNLWKVVKEISKTNETPKSIDAIKNKHGDLLTNTKDVANEFNNTFSNVGKNLAEKILPDPNYLHNRRRMPNSFFVIPTDRYEMKSLIRALKPKKSPGLDGITTEILNATLLQIIDPLVYIINRCIQDGVWPTMLKNSVVVAIHKKGDKTDSNNYRPISLISHLAKLFEKIIKKRLDSYLKKYNIIAHNQFGFKEGTSTQDALISLTNKIHNALNQGKVCLGIFLDLSKAFDTVSHHLLLQSLEDIGIRGNELKLFQSYISGRQQTVRVNGVQSDVSNIEYGVPQGTVLGPVLFNIYVNDLFSIKSTSDIIAFADDTALIYSSKSWDVLKSEVENDFVHIKNWFDHKLLTLNLEKTTFLPFSLNKTRTPTFQSLEFITPNIAYSISAGNEVKYLGVLIDIHLKWNLHINFIIKKINCMLFRFRLLKKILPIRQLKVLYHSLVESHIRYGISAWGCLSKTHIHSLEVLQKRFLKIIYSKRRTYPSDLLYEESGILDVRQLFAQNIICHYHQNKTKNQIVSHRYDTRQRGNYLVPFMKKALGQKSYEFVAPKLYNDIPKDLKEITNNHVFKKKLKCYIIAKPRNLFTKLFVNE